MAGKINPLFSRPFDQYSRQKLVFEFAVSCLGVINDSSNRVIDLGGHKGITKNFFNKSKVTILDVYDENYEGYVKGDATKLEFADDYFNLAVSFDVFEHIERSSRSAFISEAARVSKYGVFIAAPFDNDAGDVSTAEVAANDVYNKLHGKDHEWLYEHILYKIPTQQETDKQIQELGLYFTSINSNDLQIWSLFQSLTFLAEKDESAYKKLKALELEFNENLMELDTQPEVSYRKIYFISKEPSRVKMIKKMIDQLKESNTTKIQSFKNKLTQEVIAAYSSSNSEQARSLSDLQNLKIQLENTNLDQKILIEEKQQLINSYEHSALRKVTKPLRKIINKLKAK